MPLINRKSPWIRVISMALIVVVFAFIGKAFWDSLGQIDLSTLRFNPWLLSLALVLSFVASLASALLWHLILRLLGERPKIIHSWRVMVYSQIVRYLPGKVWMLLGRVHWGSKIGLSAKKTILSIFLENIFLLLGATVASVYALRLFVPARLTILLYVVAGVFLLCLHPRFIEWAINTIGGRRLNGKVRLQQFTYPHVLLLVGLYFVLWLVIGANYYLFVCSFYTLDIRHMIDFMTYVAASWLAGYLSLIAPAGLGVREGVFILIFKTVVPVPIAILTAILIRIFSTASEVVTFAVFVCFDRGAWNLFSRERRAAEVKLPAETEDSP